MLYKLNDIDPSESVTLGARQLGLGRTRPEANRDPAALGRSTFRGNATTCYWVYTMHTLMLALGSLPP